MNPKEALAKYQQANRIIVHFYVTSKIYLSSNFASLAERRQLLSLPLRLYS